MAPPAPAVSVNQGGSLPAALLRAQVRPRSAVGGGRTRGQWRRVVQPDSRTPPGRGCGVSHSPGRTADALWTAAQAGAGSQATAQAAPPSREAYTPYPSPIIFYIYNRVAQCLALARLRGPKDLEKFLTATTFLFWTHCDQELASFHDGVTWLVVFGARLPKPVQVADWAGCDCFPPTGAVGQGRQAPGRGSMPLLMGIS